MTIGQLARSAGVNVETVRFYERRGLLPEPQRKPSGYRQYHQDDIGRLRFIRRARGLGFTLHEIEELLALRVAGPRSCRAVGRRTREKISLVQRKIRELREIEHSLERLAAICDSGKRTEECPILRELGGHRV